MRSLLLLLLSGLFLATAAPSAAAPPELPDTIRYEAIPRVDCLGFPAPVDLTLRIYDAATDGLLVYVQSFPIASPCEEGVLLVGPTGDPDDLPFAPQTTVLREALVEDLGTPGAPRFFELQVGDDPPAPRERIVAVPYALRAGVADRAESSDDLRTPAGVDAVILDTIWTRFAFDGGDPPNDDPREGLADTDGDGAPNFLDEDNDDDQILDADELSFGTDLNVVTPRIRTFSRAGSRRATVDITVRGTSFLDGFLVSVGGASVETSEESESSFVMTVPPSTVTLPVVVTNPNGEASPEAPLTFLATGGGGTGASTTPPLTQPGVNLVAGQVATLTAGPGARLLASNGESAAFDIDDNDTFDFRARTGLAGVGPKTIDWNTDGGVWGLRMRNTSSGRRVELLRDANGDRFFGLSEARVLETPAAADATLHSPSLAFDADGRVVAGYVLADGARTDAIVFRDVDGDGSLDAGERQVIGARSSAGPNLGAATTGGGGRTAYVSVDPSAGALHWSFDRNGDGDFDDTIDGNPETSSLPASDVRCVDADIGADGTLAIVIGEGSQLRVLRDLDDDGDFSDAAESTALSPAGADITGCAVAGSGAATAVAVTTDRLSFVRDRNGNGVLTDAEDVQLHDMVEGPIALERSAGELVALSRLGLHIER